MRAGDGFLKGRPALSTCAAGTERAPGPRIRRFGGRKYADSRSATWSLRNSFNNPKGKAFFTRSMFRRLHGERMSHHVRRYSTSSTAGANPTTGLTALQGIDDACEVKQGESVIFRAGPRRVGTLGDPVRKSSAGAVCSRRLSGRRWALGAGAPPGARTGRAVDGKARDITGPPGSSLRGPEGRRRGAWFSPAASRSKRWHGRLKKRAGSPLRLTRTELNPSPKRKRARDPDHPYRCHLRGQARVRTGSAGAVQGRRKTSGLVAGFAAAPTRFAEAAKGNTSV